MPARTKPMPRRKPLAPGKPPTRAARLTSVTPMKRAAPAVRASSQAQPFPPLVCRLIDQRDNDGHGAIPARLCQRCGTSRDPQRHHRRGKAKGGSKRRTHTQCSCNGITLCGPGGNSCHQWAHAHPAEARAQGFIVSQAVSEPAAKGVLRLVAIGGNTVRWPSCDGQWLDEAPVLEVAA